MSTTLFWIFVMIGECFAIAATVAAVQSLRRAENIWATLNSWVVKVVDAVSGIG